MKLEGEAPGKEAALDLKQEWKVDESAEKPVSEEKEEPELLEDGSPRTERAPKNPLEAAKANGEKLDDEIERKGYRKAIDKIGGLWNKTPRWAKIATGVGLIGAGMFASGPISGALYLGASRQPGVFLIGAGTFVASEALFQNSKGQGRSVGTIKTQLSLLLLLQCLPRHSSASKLWDDIFEVPAPRVRTEESSWYQ